MRFRDRNEAGDLLADALARYRSERPLVLALPRGGVPVGARVAAALGAPLDVLCVRKVGAPGEEELGLGAVAEGGEVWLDPALIDALGVDDAWLRRALSRKKREVEEREAKFRRGRGRADVGGRVVILVDDGIATGGTVRAAIASLRKRGAQKVVLAVPVAAPSSLEQLRPLADDVVCLAAPEELWAIGIWYEDFSQTEDDEVVRLLDEARERETHAPPAGGR